MNRIAMNRATARLTLIGLLVAITGLGEVLPSAPASAAVPSFNESPGCGALSGIRGPYAREPGLIPLSEPIYGPWGDFYGRTVGHAWDQRVTITLPNMVGTPKTLWVHKRVLPALQAVVANLQAAAAGGDTYSIRYDHTWSWARYTIPPGRYFSFHAVGASIDVNSNTNPYRADNVLITDMPQWFVDAWRDAGWCWGGDWQTIKDPMHFSWKGPIHTPGYPMPAPQPPLVGPASFTAQTVLPVGLGAPEPSARHAIADMNRDGAADVVRIEPHGASGQRRLVIATSNSWYKSTSTFGATASAPTDPDAPLALADLSADGRPDLVYVLDEEGTVLLEVFEFAGGGFMPRIPLTTAAPAIDGSVYLFDDYDRDGNHDLYIVRPGSPASLEVWLGPGFSEAAITVDLSIPSAGRLFALGERTVDGIPDLFALAPNGTLVIHTGAGNNPYANSTVVSTGVDPTGESLFVADLDGDGYGDLMLVSSNGATRMRRGGASTHSPGIWFVNSTHHVTRLHGSNRYATAAAVSTNTYPVPASVETVFVATGANFPDAITGAAIAGIQGAPLLLVNADTVPAATAAELARLDPSLIVLLGGTSVISEAVEAALDAYAPTIRLAGADRYATAAAISRFGFPADGSADEVIIATGADFADALAGAPIAAQLNGPVLLTTANSLPDVIREEIIRLRPGHITVLGGPTAVSDAVFAELSALAPTTRIAGSNRYATAVEVSKQVFPTAGLMYLATGLDFPDALTGAAAAATRGAPLLLVPGTSLPDIVAAEINRLGGTSVYILGGTTAVSAGVRGAVAIVGL